MLDIPNFVTLPIELGVAFLILWMDRRQRKREADSIIRFQEQQKQSRDAEIRQRKRFANWQKENSKRQIMLLESIISTLDTDKVDDFKTEVGTRYAKEINEDMADLDELLDEKMEEDGVNPELEANIESKIEEIEIGTDFIKHFLPKDTISQMGSIAESAKTAYLTLKDLPERLEKGFPTNEGGTIRVKFDERTYNVDPQNKEEIDDLKEKVLDDYRKERIQLMKSFESSIQETINGVTEEIQKSLPDETVSGKILDAVKSSLRDTIGLGKVMDKMNKMKKSEDKEDKEDKEDSKEDESSNKNNS